MLKVLEVTKEVYDDAMESNKEAQGFRKVPPWPNCESCPGMQSALTRVDGHLRDKAVCFWGGFPRFIIDDIRFRICKYHPQYGKPWPPNEDE